MKYSTLQGIIAAIPTPFDENEELALDALAADIEKWNRTRLAGYTVLGTTGEPVSLTTDEKKRVLERARAAIPEEKVMLAGTGEESTRATARLSRFAGDIGCDYAIVLTPHYNRSAFSKSSLVDHYHRVADESGIPVLIYHIPAFTDLDLKPELVSQIAQHPNVAGIKDSSGDVTALQEMRRRCPDDFRILTGAAPALHAAFTVGADGAILADACSAHDLSVNILEAVEDGEVSRARVLQARLAELSGILIGKYGIPGVKALLARQGYSPGPPRRPLTPLTGAETDELVRAFEEAGREPTRS